MAQEEVKLKRRIFGIVLFLLVIFAAVMSTLAIPDGADNATAVNATRRAANTPESLLAIAGNVTESDFTGFSVTNFWQGFYGNVSGIITLEDGIGNALYNWSTASPGGEIYAANQTTSISWTSVMCLNYSAAAPRNNSGTFGGYGTNTMNLSELHRAFGFNVSVPSSDNVSATFKESNTHDQFDTGSLTFSAAECPTAYVFNSADAPVAGQFEEVILWDPANNATIWASILENNLNGFDQRFHDFEMLVLENGAGTETTTTLYYFWVELQ